jgi:Galactose oxidase, central domain
MTAQRGNAAASLLPNGTVLVAGGLGTGTNSASAEIYDPASGTWTATGSMSVGRVTLTATSLSNGTVLAAGGGAGGDVILSSEIFYP